MAELEDRAPHELRLRSAATAIDALLLLLIGFLLVLAFPGIARLDPRDLGFTLAGGYLILAFGLFGRSVGGTVTGLWLVNRYGVPLAGRYGLVRATVRWVVWLTFPLTSGVTALRRDARFLHDVAAGTDIVTSDDRRLNRAPDAALPRWERALARPNALQRVVAALAILPLLSGGLRIYEAITAENATAETARLRPSLQPMQSSYFTEIRHFDRTLELSAKAADAIRTRPVGTSSVSQREHLALSYETLNAALREGRGVSTDFLERAYPRPSSSRDFLGFANGQLTDMWQNGLMPGLSGAHLYYELWLTNPAEPPDPDALAAAREYFERFQTWFRSNEPEIKRGIAALPQ